MKDLITALFLSLALLFCFALAKAGELGRPSVERYTIAPIIKPIEKTTPLSAVEYNFKVQIEYKHISLARLIELRDELNKKYADAQEVIMTSFKETETGTVY